MLHYVGAAHSNMYNTRTIMEAACSMFVFAVCAHTYTSTTDTANKKMYSKSANRKKRIEEKKIYNLRWLIRKCSNRSMHQRWNIFFACNLDELSTRNANKNRYVKMESWKKWISFFFALRNKGKCRLSMRYARESVLVWKRWKNLSARVQI